MPRCASNTALRDDRGRIRVVSRRLLRIRFVLNLTMDLNQAREQDDEPQQRHRGNDFRR